MKIDPTLQRQPDAAAKPFRRRVFYIPGYDPFHPRRYRELFRKEGTEQARISGYSLDLKPKPTKGPYGWHAAATIDGQTAEALTYYERALALAIPRRSIFSSAVTYLFCVAGLAVACPDGPERAAKWEAARE